MSQAEAAHRARR